MKKTLLAIAICMTAGAAFATQGGETGNTGCNGQGNANSPCTGGTGGAGGNGGNGGNGGQGGNGGNANNSNLNFATGGTGVGVGIGVGVGGSQTQSQSTTVGASATAGSASSADSASSSGATATNAGNSLTLVQTAPAAPTKLTIRNTPDAAGYAAAPSANCRVTHGVGVSVPGLGVSASSSTLDEGCDTREDARILREAGFPDAAVARMCQKPELKKALGPLCFE